MDTLAKTEVEEKIAFIAYMGANRFVSHAEVLSAPGKSAAPLATAKIAICLVYLKDGTYAIGKGDGPLGDASEARKLAYEQAIAQLVLPSDSASPI